MLMLYKLCSECQNNSMQKDSVEFTFHTTTWYELQVHVAVNRHFVDFILHDEKVGLFRSFSFRIVINSLTQMASFLLANS